MSEDWGTYLAEVVVMPLVTALFFITIIVLGLMQLE